MAVINIIVTLPSDPERFTGVDTWSFRTSGTQSNVPGVGQGDWAVRVPHTLGPLGPFTAEGIIPLKTKVSPTGSMPLPPTEHTTRSSPSAQDTLQSAL